MQLLSFKRIYLFGFIKTNRFALCYKYGNQTFNLVVHKNNLAKVAKHHHNFNVHSFAASYSL